MLHVKLVLIFLFAMAVVSADPEDLQFEPGRDIVQITPCPNSPNCVSSLSHDPDHKIEPLRHDLAENNAMVRLQKIIEDMPRTTITQATTRFLRAEFKSLIFRFVDDVELVAREASGVIHVRSASRVGYWDLGANRRRVEQIREKFAQVR